MPAVLTPREWGAMVREARTRLDLTQAELAARIGSSRYWVVAFEAGKPGAELGLALKALKALGLRVDITPVGPGMNAVPQGSSPPDSPAEVLERLRLLVNPPATRRRAGTTRSAKKRR